ncbi:MAG: DUF3575 domain-containing protein [Muribaculaceae bacterium]|nr:DUF3575 domain-containing protein [Muribaculaceae bacterium]
MHVSLRSLAGKIALFLSLVAAAFAMSPGASAQRIALKTNAIDYMILSPNLTLEARLSRVLSIQLGLAACPITKPIHDIKLTNFRVEPELRYWFNRPMARHFVALSFSAVNYSLRHADRYFTGDAVLAGVSYGYSVVLSDHWNMEAEIGVGIGTFSGYDYVGANNKPDGNNFRHVLPVPVRFGLSFGYIFK